MSARKSVGKRARAASLLLVPGLLFAATANAGNSPPVISGTAPATAVIGETYDFQPVATDPDNDRLRFEARGLPRWATLDKHSGRVYGSPRRPDQDTWNDVTISVSDGKASAALPPFRITVVDPAAATGGEPPSISGSPATSATVGELYAFQPTASDPDGDSLRFSVANKPAWATFTGSTGLLSGIPPAGSAGSYPGVTVSVSDGQSQVSLPSFDITVGERPNTPPTISGTPGTSVNADASYLFRPSAHDADGQPLGFSIANKPAWASFNPNDGTLSGTPTREQGGTYPGIVVSVSDGQDSASLPSFSITVVTTNRPPSISGSPAAAAVVGEFYGFQPTASDPDGDSLRFSIANKPSWATFTASTGLLSGIPPDGSAGTYPDVRVSVSDGQTSVSLAPFAIDVSGPANRPPEIWGMPETSATAGTAYGFRPSASDPDGDTLSFSVQGLPAWASFDTVSGALSGTPTAAHAGTYSNIVVSVADGEASDSLAPFSIAVVALNQPPTISGSPDDYVTVGQAYGFTPGASDPDGDSLRFSIANKPAWAAFDTGTGRLHGTPAASAAGTYEGIVITASDGEFSASLPAFSLTVVPTTPGSATVSWTPPTSFVDGTPIANLAGYLVAYGPSAEDFSSSLRVGSPEITSATIEGLAVGTWYFAVRAYTTDGVESDLSQVAQKTIR